LNWVYPDETNIGNSESSQYVPVVKDSRFLVLDEREKLF
jgi:hypothetical protein